MHRSRLFDKGREVMLVYPQEFRTDERGARVLVVSDTPVEIRVTTLEGRGSDAELPGNVTARVLEVFTRSAPVGSWARVHFDGEDWDIAMPPRFVKGMSKATSYTTFIIRSRNQVGEGAS